MSTIPQIISPTHERITFKTGQAENTFTLVSQPDGQIGFVTLVITPEIPGTYVPFSFEIVVRGFASASFAADVNCIASGISAPIELTIDPIAPETVTFVAQSTNGVVTPQTVTILNGQNTATFNFIGSAIAASSVTFTSSIYLPYTLKFNTLGQIKTVKSSVITAAAPNQITVSTVPSNPSSVTVTTTSDNLEVTPTQFTLPAKGSASIEVIADISGTSSITYSAANYCPHTDFFTVNSAPICSAGYHTNYFSTSCAICPGNNVFTKVFGNSCNLRGECTYSTCVTSAARCICDAPYLGAACQWDPTSDSFTQVGIDNTAFTVSLDDVQETSGSVEFTVPSNFVASRDVGGNVFVAAYTASNSVFIDPSVLPPTDTTATPIGWRFEVDCPDNTYETTTFALPVSVVIPVDGTLTQFELALSDIYYYDVTISAWREASRYCSSSAYSYVVDFPSGTISTSFCRPGQYNIFIAPPPALPANTGHSLNPHPSDSVLGAVKPTTGVTGNNPIPPPLPVFTNTNGDPSPVQKFVDEKFDDNSSSLLSFSPLLVAVLLIFFF